jgi:subtilisin family serine protease
MECFEWFLAPYDYDKTKPDPAQAPHVINNSWYCSVEEGCNPSNFKLMEEIVWNLRSSGVVVVVSAGNQGSQGCSSVTGPPAFFEPSFSVGATNDQDVIAGFSSKGPVVIDSSFRLKPNVSAPGVAVRSVVKGGNYAAFSGTSMAGPHVAGAVALIIEANPSLEGEVDLIEDILESTAVPKEWNQDCGNFPGSKIPNPAYGFGRIDALAAVKKAKLLLSGASSSDFLPVRIFPNPSTGIFTVSCSQNQEVIRRVELRSQMGLTVTSIKSDGEPQLQINTQGMVWGLYYYHVETSQGSYFGKLVINPQ